MAVYTTNTKKKPWAAKKSFLLNVKWNWITVRTHSEWTYTCDIKNRTLVRLDQGGQRYPNKECWGIFNKDFRVCGI